MSVEKHVDVIRRVAACLSKRPHVNVRTTLKPNPTRACVAHGGGELRTWKGFSVRVSPKVGEEDISLDIVGDRRP